MKKNIAYGLLSMPLFVIAGGIWLLSAIPERVLVYADEGADSVAIIKTLDFTTLTDAPGYAAAMGRSDGKDNAKTAVANEHEAWGRLSLPGYKLLGEEQTLECVSELHDERLSFFNEIANMPSSGIIPLSDANRLIKKARILSIHSSKCHTLAEIDLGWKSRLWKRITSS